MARGVIHQITAFTLVWQEKLVELHLFKSSGCFAGIYEAPSAWAGMTVNVAVVCPLNTDGTPDFDNVGEVEDWSDAQQLGKDMLEVFEVEKLVNFN